MTPHIHERGSHAIQFKQEGLEVVSSIGFLKDLFELDQGIGHMDDFESSDTDFHIDFHFVYDLEAMLFVDKEWTSFSLNKSIIAKEHRPPPNIFYNSHSYRGPPSLICA